MHGKHEYERVTLTSKRPHEPSMDLVWTVIPSAKAATAYSTDRVSYVLKYAPIQRTGSYVT